MTTVSHRSAKSFAVPVGSRRTIVCVSNVAALRSSAGMTNEVYLFPDMIFFDSHHCGLGIILACSHNVATES